MPKHYKTNPNWENRKRKSDDDVLLESTVFSDKLIQAESTLIHWLKRKEQGTVSVDGKNITCWYCGGTWFHYTLNVNFMSLYIHSSGEDAFDSLAYCANEIAEILYKNHPDTTIRWTEHPHRRQYLKETMGS
ncbi:TPA: hypothetical protein ACGT9I_001372 [Salmonella enterica]